MLDDKRLFEVFRDVVRESKISVAQLADELGCSVSMVYKWMEDPHQSGNGAELRANPIPIICRLADDYRLLNFLAHRCNHIVFKNNIPEGEKNLSFLSRQNTRKANCIEDIAGTDKYEAADKKELLKTIDEQLNILVAIKEMVLDGK
jgi:hypothetical protein